MAALVMHPYVQGWPHTANGPDTPDTRESQRGGKGKGNASSEPPVSPSIYGMLPYPTPHITAAPTVFRGVSPVDIVHVAFTSFAPTILNSVAYVGQRSLYSPTRVIKITPDESMPGYTVFKEFSSGKHVALVEWKSHPVVEVRGYVKKIEIRHWLKLSRDKTYRAMQCGSAKYIWSPASDCVNLYREMRSGSAPVQPLATISKVRSMEVSLQISPQAMDLGLLEVIIVAGALLLSGRNID